MAISILSFFLTQSCHTSFKNVQYDNLYWYHYGDNDLALVHIYFFFYVPQKENMCTDCYERTVNDDGTGSDYPLNKFGKFWQVHCGTHAKHVVSGSCFMQVCSHDTPAQQHNAGDVSKPVSSCLWSWLWSLWSLFTLLLSLDVMKKRNLLVRCCKALWLSVSLSGLCVSFCSNSSHPQTGETSMTQSTSGSY